MSMEDLIAKVAPTKVLPSDHLLAVYAYVGARETGRPRFDLHYPTAERNPRKPNAYFAWDATSSSNTNTWDSGFGGLGGRITRNATVSDNGQVLTCTGTGWITAYGLAEWYPKTGVYDWEILLDQYNTTNTYNVVVGMVPAVEDTSMKNSGPIAYSTTPGWGFITGQGQVTQYGGSVTTGMNYQFQCARGDRVGVRYDSDRGLIYFFRNNVQVPGQAFRVTGKSVRPAVSCVQQQRLRLMFNCKFPKLKDLSNTTSTTSSSLSKLNNWEQMEE